jgi:peptide/nickel transport system ATP-binding protein
VTSLAAAAGSATDTTEVVARISDLSVTFRRGGLRIQAVRGVSLDIRRGEILGLVGESGSGKSVLGLSLLGLLPGLLPGDPRPETGGEVSVCGSDMLRGSPAQRRSVRRQHLGAVFQDPMTSLNPTMRIGRQVAEAAGSRAAGGSGSRERREAAESRAEAVRLLRAVGIPDAERRLNSFPHELSGGLRQRVMIAMAIAGRPSLVVADEPTTALDVMVQAQVLTLLRSLRDEIGCSFLMITHDLGVAAQVADRIAVLYGGRLAELGPAGTVLRSAAHPYSAALTRSRVSLAVVRGEPLPTLAGEVPDPAAPPPGCPFEPRCGLAVPECSAEVPEVIEVAVDHLSACILPPSEVAAAFPPAAQPDDRHNHPAITGSLPQPSVSTAPVVHAARVHDVVKTFRVKAGRHRVALTALRGVDLELAEGESVAIVGESGSGKSTLLRVVAGLERSDRGQIALGHAADRPQMVFQDAGASLTPWMTVGALIAERLRRQSMTAPARRDRVREVLNHVGLNEHVAHAKAAQLSGGQRQRVALARATVIPPEVLLCDEPTSALDVSLAAVVLNLISRLRAELGMAVLFVTHDLAVARVVADRIAVMYLGRVVELGRAEEVVANPRHPYTKALVEAVPEPGRPAREVLPGEPASPLAPPPGCAFHPRCPVREPVCADPDFEPRLIRMGAESKVACIHAEAM